MNFVDVQPKSFLDYAWTSPSPAVMSAAKPSKTSRKQNRCCDQCRKGKRACDAAILEDTLLDTSNSPGTHSVFHYSDVFGPLAPCGNCEKTKKECTFEWLRSQRVLQAAQPPASAAPPAKRRRRQSNSSGSPQIKNEPLQPAPTARPELHPIVNTNPTPLPDTYSAELGITFADFPGGFSTFDTGSMTLFQPAPSTSFGRIGSDWNDNLSYFSEASDKSQTHPNCDSGQGSSVGTLSEIVDGDFESERASTTTPANGVAASTTSSTAGSAVTRISRKRRRRSPGPISNGAIPCPAISFANDLLSSTNNAYLTEGLLKIYHDSFSNALACWLTERTCPYSARAEMPMEIDASLSPNWDQIYHRVFRLDRLAASIRGRQLTFLENKAASHALNMAIYAFSSQWAQSSERSRAKYPFNGDEKAFDAGRNSAANGVEFDRALQISAWHEARNALQNVGGIESFRVVLAEIVFALTQKPIDYDGVREEQLGYADETQDNFTNSTQSAAVSEATADVDDQDIVECEDLMSKLDIAMDTDGPPVHLEKGARLIHSLRSRMAMRGGKSTSKSSLSRSNPSRPSASRLELADRATVDLLFWLGVMFDTLSAAMHKRPLVVSDEDSDMVLNESRQVTSPTSDGMEVAVTENDGHWDDYLFSRQQARLQNAPSRWPCSFDQAAATLCDAAPIKVLLFRRVTRIQTLLARNSRGERVEKSLNAALEVCDHWNRSYAPFIQDCILNHDQLPPRVQSWYICLTGHWHLATLLLADLIEIVDESELGTADMKNQRDSTEFVAKFREGNCHSLSDLAKCACPREDASFPQSRDFHFAVNQGALLTEPWTAVLIRAFAKAGVVLLESEAMLPSCIDQEDAFQRADNCVQALWCLGRKSDMALSAAKILGDALKQRRKSVQQRVDAMSAFLETELWHGFEGLDDTFDVDCQT